MSIYTLNEINEMIYNLQQLIQEGADDETVQIALQSIESVEIERGTKLDSYAMVIKNLTHENEGLKAEEKRFAERRKRNENAIERMKQAVADTLLTVEGNRLKTDKFNYGFRKSTVVQIEDESLIPPQFIKTTTAINKAELKKALQDAVPIDGASLIENQSLQIK